MPSLSELLDVSNWIGENSELGSVTMGTPHPKRTREKEPSSCLPPTKKKRMPRTGTEQSNAQDFEQHQVTVPYTIPYISACGHTPKVKIFLIFFLISRKK